MAKSNEPRLSTLCACKTIKETDNDKTKAVAEVAKYPTKSADLLKIEDENKQYKPLLP